MQASIRSFRVLALATVGLLWLAGTGAAEPPAGSTCVGGYNPDATSNVCYTIGSNPGSPSGTRNTGSVDPAGSELCVIGNTCAPVPTRDPDGGVEYPYPGTPGTPTVGPAYVELLGNEVVPGSDGGFDACVPATGDIDTCVYVCDGDDGESCIGASFDGRNVATAGAYDDWETGDRCTFVSVGSAPNGIHHDSCERPETA